MGNSPSKNDPLPNSQVNLNGINDSINEDNDPDERSSALSKYNRSSAIRIEQKNLNYNYGKRNKKSIKEDLTLEIDNNFVNLLKSNSFQGNYGSSIESDMSPIFTTNELKETDLILSLGSSPNSRDLGRDFESDIVVGNLDPINEDSVESTPVPEPIRKDDININLLNNKVNKININVSNSSLTSSTSSSPVSFTPPSSAMVSINSKNAYPVDIDGIIERLIKIGKTKKTKTRKNKDKFPFSSEEIKFVLNKSRSIFSSQPTLLKLAPPVKIVGDLHGQFEDLIRIFNKCGYPPYSNYLFLGDYVDRGHKSLETILLLLCFKIKYPENFFMLRGNHESANITKIYGFYDECKRRLSSLTGNHKMWKVFVDVFNTLPIAATINDKIFCIHGGLSPDLVDLKQIEDIKRPTDIPDKGLLADLLWSDPDASVKTFSLTHWPKNDRGVSYCFGKKHVDYFCATFKFDLIVRGHMVVEDGYEFFDKKKLVTIFLAPNYCGEFNNYGAIMDVDKSLCCSFDMLKPN